MRKDKKVRAHGEGRGMWVVGGGVCELWGGGGMWVVGRVGVGSKVHLLGSTIESNVTARARNCEILLKSRKSFDGICTQSGWISAEK